VKSLKTFLLGLVVGMLLGLWFGYNHGKGREFYSNPFADRDVQENIKSKLKEGREAVGEGVEKMGEGIKGKIENQ
jgi:hypothetical protein